MKKKLLLSSVAALTLFAAYTTATAEEYGKYGEPIGERKLPDADSIEKAQSYSELEKVRELYQARQDKVNVLRVKYAELNKAKENEASSRAEVEQAQRDYDKALETLTEAMNTQYDAAAQLDKLEGVLKSVQGRLEEDRGALTEYKALLNELKAKQLEAANKLAEAEAYVQKHRTEKPVAGAPLDELKQYDVEHYRRERLLENAKDAKTLADNAVEKTVQKIEELKTSIQKGEDNEASLKKATDQLKVVVGNRESEENTGLVRGVAVAALQHDLKVKWEILGDKSNKRLHAASYRKDAQEDYDEALAKAQEVYKTQGVAFVLEEVLETAKRTDVYFKEFGWNKDKAGNWNYLLDSDGTKATSRWINDNGSWYYLGQDGVMKKWWVKVDGTWYYLNGSGAMQTGWLQDNGNWYYLEASGAMKANQWFEVGGKWYHVDATGALSVNTTVDGYNVNENGEWV